MRRACELDPASRRLLIAAIDRLGLSARAQDRILKVARTIADLAAEEKMDASHVAEALQYSVLSMRRSGVRIVDDRIARASGNRGAYARRQQACVATFRSLTMDAGLCIGGTQHEKNAAWLCCPNAGRGCLSAAEPEPGFATGFATGCATGCATACTSGGGAEPLLGGRRVPKPFRWS